MELAMVVTLIAVALIVDCINGFHDAANSIATVVSTRVLSPLIGLTFGLGLMVAIYWLFRRTTPTRVDHWFRKLRLTSAALFSLNHGANDAQKTMGIIAGVLFTVPACRGIVTDTAGTMVIPFWVVLLAHTAIGLGTLSGGWRIIHTMG